MRIFAFEIDTLSITEVIEIPFKISPAGMVIPAYDF